MTEGEGRAASGALRFDAGRVALVVAFGALAGLAVLLLVAEDTEASHFRGGTLYAEPTGSGNGVVFHGQIAFRREFFGTPGPVVGDLFFGDSISTGDGGSVDFQLRVIEVNAAQNWIVGEIEALDDTVGVVYTGYPSATQPGGAPWIASWDGSARLSNGSPNHLINNHDDAWRLETSVNVGNHPPQAELDPIQFCAVDALCRMDLPVSDVDSGDVVTVRFSTGPEATGGAFDHTGPIHGGGAGTCPDPLTTATLASGEVCLLASNGFGIPQLVWNTVGATHETPEPGERTFYSEQLMLEDHATNAANPVRSKTPVDFLIRLTQLELPRWIDPSPCAANVAYVGGALSVEAGAMLNFQVQAQSDAVGAMTADPLRPMELFAVGTLPSGMTVGATQGPDASPSGYAPNPILRDITFTPPASTPPGALSVTFYAQDIQEGIAAPLDCVVVINVTPPIPDAFDAIATIAEDTVLAGNLVASGGNGNALTYAVGSSPAHGLLAVSASGAYTYTPAAAYNGPDAFTFNVNDGTSTSNVATVAITVTPVNDPPVAIGDDVTIFEGTGYNDVFGASDEENDLLTYTVLSVSSGTLVVGPGNNFQFTTATPDFNGVVTIVFRANDGNADSNTATLTIHVVPVNDAPVAIDDALATLEEVPVQFTLTGLDVDGDPLALTIVTGPSAGTLAHLGGNLYRYTPGSDFAGTDQLLFIANDGALDSSVATITIDVLPANDLPVAQGDAWITDEDTSLAHMVTGSDVDGDTITFATATPPAHGSLVLQPDGQSTYTPDANYNGPDAFTFTANDGSGTSAPASVVITVLPVNDAPALTSHVFATLEDQDVTGPTSGTDLDGDALTLIVTTAPTRGVALIAGTLITYAPTADRCDDPLPDAMEYRLVDPSGAMSSIETVRFFVTCVNDGPLDWTALPPIVVAEDSGSHTFTLQTGLLNANGDSLGLPDEVDQLVHVQTLVGNAALFQGTLTVTPTTYVATPATAVLSFQTAPDACGSTTLSLVVEDSGGAANGGRDRNNATTMLIDITCINDAPVAQPDHIVAYCDHTRSLGAPGVLDNDDDVDQDTLVAQFIGPTPTGPFSLASNGALTYTPSSPCPIGILTTTYRAVDLAGLSSTTTLDLDVRVNHAPVPDFTANPWLQVQGGCIQFTNLSHDDDANATLGLGIVRYRWEFADGETTPTEHPLHCFTEAGHYNVRLFVEDDAGELRSIERMVTIIYLPAPEVRSDAPQGSGNLAPGHLQVAAGPELFVEALQDVELYATVTGGRAPYSYSWTQMDGPTAAMAGITTDSPSVQIPAQAADVILWFEVQVRDADGLTATAQVALSVSPRDLPPELEPPATLTVPDGSLVHLDASGAYDPEGDALSFTWRQTRGQPVYLRNATEAQPVFAAPAAPYTRTLVFEVEVSDGHNIVVRYATVQLEAVRPAQAHDVVTTPQQPVAGQASEADAPRGDDEPSASRHDAGSAPFPWVWLVGGAGVAAVAWAGTMLARARRTRPKG